MHDVYMLNESCNTCKVKVANNTPLHLYQIHDYIVVTKCFASAHTELKIPRIRL
jgi:hypothetical protein